MSEASLEPETDADWQAKADAYEAKEAYVFEEAERREEAAEIARRKRMLGDNLRPMDVESFLRLDLPKRDCLLDPVFPERGLAMLYAPRGSARPGRRWPSGWRWPRAGTSCAGGRPTPEGCSISMER